MTDASSWRDTPPDDEEMTPDWRALPADDEDTTTKFDSTTTKSEAAAANLRNLPASVVDPRADFAASLASSIAAPIVSGVAGIAGGIAGMVPGGDTPDEKAAKWQAGTQEYLTHEPVTQEGAKGMEYVEKGIHGITTGLKYAGSGIAGMGAYASAIGEGHDKALEEAAFAKQNFRETPNAVGEGIYGVTQSPALAALGSAYVPTLLMGGPRPRPTARGGPGHPRPIDVPEGYGGVTRDAKVPEYRPGEGQTTQIPPSEAPAPKIPEAPAPKVVRTDKEAFAAAQDALIRGDKAALMQIADANPAIIAAFEALGIDWNVGMVSMNAALREVQANAKAKNPELGAFDDSVQGQLLESGETLVNKHGTTDRVAIHENVQRDMRGEATRLENVETQAFKELKDATHSIQRTEVDATAVAERLELSFENKGGGDLAHGLTQATKLERELFNITHRPIEIKGKPGEPSTPGWEYRAPTWAAVDGLRRKIGESMPDHNVFGNASAGALKQAYGELKTIQDRVAKGEDFLPEWNAANAATVAKKAHQENMQTAFGPRLDKSITAKIDQAANNMVKGDLEVFNQVIEALPGNQRPVFASAVLNNLFKPGAQKVGELSAGFVKNFGALKRNSGAMDALFKYLPKSARKTFMDLGTAAEGFFLSMAKNNNSRSAHALLQELEKGSFVSRIAGDAWNKLMSVPGINVVGQGMKRDAGAMAAAAKARVEAATNLFNDPVLRQAISEFVRGNKAKAEMLLKGSNKFKAWLELQPPATQHQIAQSGVIVYLTQKDE